MDLPSELRVLTLNCWGLKFISKLRTERLSEIGRRVASLPNPPHIVALQECFVTQDFDSIRASCASILPHAKFYYGGAFGGGLAILSRWPIEESSVHRYPLNGRPTAFWRGDWYVGKGVACAQIRIRISGPGGEPKEQMLSIFNTHTHSPYTENQPGDSYLAHRLAQAWEMSKLLRGAAQKGHLVLALGDFNMRPLSLPHKTITAHAPVRDIWRVLHPDSSLGAVEDPLEKPRAKQPPTAEFNLRENGATSDGSYNTWRWPKELQKKLGEGKKPIVVAPDTIDLKGKRLDYIFLGSPPSQDGGGWVVREAQVGMVEPHPTLGCSLSDHFSVEATLVYHDPSPGGNNKSSANTLLSAQLEPITTNDVYLSGDEYEKILSVTREYVQREEKQRYWRGLHFFAWFFVLIACLVGVWFSPYNFVAFILMLLSSLGMVAGVVDGLMSLLFFNSELRALKEFEWEINNVKTRAHHNSSEPRRETKI
ncbi:endonuclease/Exonuclease/phosphatase [Colletotrichum truncatum]|uniref:Endonuclease/Exonuclease/phosphatase n=1 Tax=Colletotrichum truncatum TaxID=5467 RepID=A0ACC3Z5E8_COLTU|nr:endonuclease/Exonuclease/phosphatase [Colletotrichum truncatum]KAF6795202.1 endonuclease/Exonuclease/phosphatase [Colletotrichum truncatum]